MASADSSTHKLSFHKGSGQWCKVIKGKRWYLGKDHDKALEAWFKYRADFEQGVDPRKSKDSANRYLAIRDGCNLFLDRRKEEMSAVSWKSLRYQCKQVVEFFGPNALFHTLTPEHFSSLRAHMDKGSPVSLANKIVRVRTIFNWLADRDYIDKPKFGLDFKPPGRKAVRRHRREQANRVASPAEFWAITNELGVQLRACAYLGLNCGFGPTDCYELPTSVVDLAGGVIHWARVKTEADRICPLWPETVQALELWNHCRTKDRGKRRFFDFTLAAIVSNEFHEGVVRAGKSRSGLSFYSLRHTLATISRECNDDSAVRVILGHVDDSILDEHYTHRFPRERLTAVTEHVRQWLLNGRDSR